MLVEDRHYKINKETGCWEWLRCVHHSGYGIIQRNKKTWIASRYSYTVYKEEIPKGLYVLHKCDNPKCINPDHLFLGTAKDNMTDCRNKKRKKGLVREAHPYHKLKHHDVCDIVMTYKTGKFTQKELAIAYKVSETLIWKIVNGKLHNYEHLITKQLGVI